MRFRCNLAKLMEEKEISINRLALEIGVSRQALNEYHKDRLKRYDSKILAKLCQLLECRLEELLVLENEGE